VEVVRANGLDIAYERTGAGSPLVLVHGAGDNSRVRQIAALSDEFTVVAWDEPGAGSSSVLPVDFGLADYAHCLGALIEALALGPAHIAGLSWGGTVALELYRRHPRLVASHRAGVIPRCGHVSNLDRPERFNAAVRAFCRAHPGR
jgi:pimeloyl-ACP methyl ester carboxylesterase